MNKNRNENASAKYLMRAWISPFPEISVFQILSKNLIGNNIGNLLFPYGISRVLMTGHTTIRTMAISKEISERQVQKINETYDAFLIPLANAFRTGFIDELKQTTAFVKKLNIPCIIIGAGAQARLGKEVNNPELESAVRDFINAVLEKSSLIGLRGEFTADYLTKMGYIPEKHFTVIGCPSLYLYGEALPVPEPKELSRTSLVSMNSKMQLPQKFHDFMFRSMKKFENCCYIPQVIHEIRHMYYQAPIPDGFVKKIPQNYLLADRTKDPAFPKPISFVDAATWLSFLEQREFSFGSRIHGNIAAILAGIPAFIIVSDERIKELVTYHHIPHLMMQDLDERTDIFDLYENADFSQISKYHKKNYEHYVDFLHANNLTTSFENQEENSILPFDRIKQAHTPLPALTAYSDASGPGKLRRDMEYNIPKKYLKKLIHK